MKTVEQKFSNGDQINDYNATAYVDGFSNNPKPTLEDNLTAWAHLIRTGLCWLLQGRIGREANDLIESGAISSTGEIDWNQIDILQSQY